MARLRGRARSKRTTAAPGRSGGAGDAGSAGSAASAGGSGGRLAGARIACVRLPDMAINLALRDEPALARLPLAIVAVPGLEAISETSRVYAASPAAAAAGVLHGTPLAQARRICPEIAVRPTRAQDYRDTLAVVLDALSAFTSAVEPIGFEHSWLAASGLVPRGGHETSLASELIERVRHQVGLPVRVGIAHGKLTSRIVARYLQQRSAMALPEGREVGFLGGLAVRYLPLSDPSVRHLRQLGIGKVLQFAGLPGAGILPRFGYEGLRAWRLAHGEDDQRIQPWRAAPVIEAAHVFPDPISNHRSLRHHVERLIACVVAPLAEQYRMTSEIVLDIAFEDGTRAERRRELLEPTGNAATLLAQADGLMAQISWSAPVERVALSARGLCPTVAHQLALFRREHEDRTEITATLRDIQSRFGAEAVCRARLLAPDAPLHERRAALQPWAVAGGGAHADRGGGGVGGRNLTEPGAELGIGIGARADNGTGTGAGL